MPHPLDQWRTTSCGNQIRHSPRATHIVDDLAPGLTLKHIATHQRRREVSRNEATSVINEKETISVPIEGKADISAFLNDAAFQVDAIFWLHRVQTVVGQTAVWIQEHANQFNGQTRTDLFQNRSDHAVAGIGYHFEFFYLGRID